MQHLAESKAKLMRHTVTMLLGGFVLVLVQSMSVQAQWTTNGNNINNTNTGNVGIGTTAPASLLEVKAGQPDLALNHSNTALYSRVLFKENGSDRAAFQFLGSTFATPTRRNAMEFFNNYGAIVFFTDSSGNGVERLKIDTSGNIGIGTAAPTAKLHVVGNGYVTGSLTVDGNIGEVSGRCRVGEILSSGTCGENHGWNSKNFPHANHSFASLKF